MTGSSYGPAYTPLAQTPPKTVSAGLCDGNPCVPLSRPLSSRLTQTRLQTGDVLWAVIFSAGGNVSVTLRCGGYSETAELSGTGAFKLQMPLSGPGGQISAVLHREGSAVLSLVPAGFVFSHRPTSYNFNAFVASSA